MDGWEDSGDLGGGLSRKRRRCHGRARRSRRGDALVGLSRREGEKEREREEADLTVGFLETGGGGAEPAAATDGEPTGELVAGPTRVTNPAEKGCVGGGVEWRTSGAREKAKWSTGVALIWRRPKGRNLGKDPNSSPVGGGRGGERQGELGERSAHPFMYSA